MMRKIAPVVAAVSVLIAAGAVPASASDDNSTGAASPAADHSKSGWGDNLCRAFPWICR
ncbi:MAG: hypothetical protein Q4P32_09865 [Micrococcales bacterium]|nr:hypothetical protein [Micrococcales bacterium]